MRWNGGCGSIAVDRTQKAQCTSVSLAAGDLQHSKICCGLVPVCTEALEMVPASYNRVVAGFHIVWCDLADRTVEKGKEHWGKALQKIKLPMFEESNHKFIVAKYKNNHNKEENL